MFRWFPLLLFVLFPSLALAQVFDPGQIDYAHPKLFLVWLGALPPNLGLLLFAIVASVRRSVEQHNRDAAATGGRVLTVSRRTWQLLAFSAGLSIALLLHVTTGSAVLFVLGWPGAVLFGIVAGAIAVWGRDLLKTLAGFLPGAAAQTAPAQPAPVPTADPAPQTAPEPASAAPESQEPATPSPDPIPAPVEAAPAPKDPDMLTLMTLLSGALSLGATPPTTGQTTALGTWVDTWLPKLRLDVQALGSNLNAVTLLGLARDVIPAANQLAGVFTGADRAEVVTVTLRFVVQEFAPPAVAAQLAPMLASGTIEGIVEGIYRELFPAPVTAPVVNAPELPSGAGVTQ